MQYKQGISIIVIGFNEATNLDSTFNAIDNVNYPKELLELIYVDSGSTDNSVEIAKKYCNKVFIENDWPTASRNRNRGLIESKYDICHFIDGDIIIDPDYLNFAVNKLNEGIVHVVFGYLEEKSNKGLNKILLQHYKNRKPGYIDAPGAGGTYIKQALIDVNAWDERIPRGEEMDIGNRLEKKGYKIWFLEKKMGIHDFGVNNLASYCKRQINEGVSICKVVLIPSNEKFINHIKHLAVRNIQFHIIVFFIFLLSIISGYILVIPTVFVLYLGYLFVKYRIVRKIIDKDTLFYYFLQNLTKSFVLYGYYKFYFYFLKLGKNDKNGFLIRINIEKEIATNKIKNI